MSKKKVAAAVAALLTVVAGVLSQCPDDPPVRAGDTVDAGAP